MKKIVYALSFIAAIACLTTCTSNGKKQDSGFEKKADEIISQMTLDEKLTQLKGMNS